MRLPLSHTATHDSSSSTHNLVVTQSPNPAVAGPSCQTMNDLARIMQWRQQGLLSDSEFLAAKRAVGLQ